MSPDILPKDVAVTTSLSADDEVVLRAQRVAVELECPYVVRGDESLSEVRQKSGREVLLVFTGTEVRLVSADDVFWYHPNMARTRIECALHGEADRLARYAELGEGDRFLDATCGLGADATVMAHVVGDSGHVTAVEASHVLAVMVREGKQIYTHRTQALIEAMRRVEVVSANSLSYLESLPDNAYDVVYFDPMFEGTLDRSQGLDLVRKLACKDTLSRAMVEQGRRVASKWVVVKDRVPGRTLAEFGCSDVSVRGRLCYGRIGP